MFTVIDDIRSSDASIEGSIVAGRHYSRDGIVARMAPACWPSESGIAAWLSGPKCNGFIPILNHYAQKFVELIAAQPEVEEVLPPRRCLSFWDCEGRPYHFQPEALLKLRTFGDGRCHFPAAFGDYGEAPRRCYLTIVPNDATEHDLRLLSLTLAAWRRLSRTRVVPLFTFDAEIHPDRFLI